MSTILFLFVVVVVVFVVIDERWRDSRAFEHFFYLVYYYNYTYQCVLCSVAIVECIHVESATASFKDLV